MFFTLILENANGNRVDMTATANQYMTSKVEDLNPPPGTISTSNYAGMDGSYLNKAFIEKRNVVTAIENDCTFFDTAEVYGEPDRQQACDTRFPPRTYTQVC